MYRWVSELSTHPGSQQPWFNGRMLAFQARDAGPIPAGCISEIRLYIAPLAYLVEHYISNVKVAGSIPAGSLYFLFRERKYGIYHIDKLLLI